MKTLIIVILLLMVEVCNAQKALKNEPTEIKKVVTSNDEIIKAQRYTLVGIGAMLAGGVIILFASRNTDNRNWVFVGVGLSFVGLAAIIEGQNHLKEARQLKKF